MMLRNLTVLTAAVLAVAACAKSQPEAEPAPEVVGARIATNLEAPIARGDCKEAVRRALANPDLDVEKVAAPKTMAPPALDMKKAPKGVADRNGWFNVKFHVLVDTLGKADMKTFAVDTASHPWLATSVKNAVGKWTFAPAEVAGCKIPRNYSLGISPRGKTPAPVTKPAAKAPAKPAAKKPPIG